MTVTPIARDDTRTLIDLLTAALDQADATEQFHVAALIATALDAALKQGDTPDQ